MATELVNTTANFSSLFYVILISVIVILALIIFFVKKLRYNSKQIWKSILVSLSITLGVEIIFLTISFFSSAFVLCQSSTNCPSNIEYILNLSPYTFPAIFLIVMLIYYIIKIIKFSREKIPK